MGPVEATYLAWIDVSTGARATLLYEDGAEVELVDQERREHRLREGLESAKDRFDFIIIDCPPTLGLLTINALVASDGVIIPVQTQYYSLKGFRALVPLPSEEAEALAEAEHIDLALCEPAPDWRFPARFVTAAQR